MAAIDRWLPWRRHRQFDRHADSGALARQTDITASLLVMAWVVEARDPYTGGHLWRVSRFARLLAEAMALPPASVARIGIGGFVHDLGKITISDAILNKKDRLTDAEYDIVKTHPSVGLRLLAGHPLTDLVRPAVLSHHERPDGRGYPDGLKDDAFGLEARIVGICDAFDAMTSARPYRPGMPIAKALGIIEHELGQQFDPVAGESFLELGRQGQLNHIVGHSDAGIPLQDCPMCGPTLAIRRDQKVGERIFCRNPDCRGEFVIEATGTKARVRFTGQQGSARDLEPHADTALIAAVVREAATSVAALDV